MITKSFLFFCTILYCTISFSQVGIGTAIPDASSILEVQSTTKGFLPPRMTQSQRDAIASPANGLVVYCTDCKSGEGCLQVNDGTPGTPSWNCVGSGTSGAATGTVSVVCNGFVTGTYVSNIAINGTYTVTITNNTLTAASITPSLSDLTYSGVSGTITTTAVSPSVATTLLSGNSLTITYTVSGTPTSTGTLVGTWTKLAYNCSKTKEISGISSLLAANYCENATLNGTYVSAVPFTSSTTFKVTLTNTSETAINNLPAPALSNLLVSFSGTPTTFTVASVSPSTTFNLAVGASQDIIYRLSGTPTSVGTLELTWNYSDLSCNKTRYIGLGDATFTKATNNRYVFSANDITLTPNVIYQGTLATATVISVPYINGFGSYIAYASPFTAIPSEFCEDGASDWTFGYSYSAGTFTTSGAIAVTLITKKNGVITPWPAKRVPLVTIINFNCVSLPLVCNDNVYTNTIGLDEGGDAIRAAISITGNVSAAAYDAASPDSWISITEAEYNQMALMLNANKGIMSDAQLPPLGLSIWGGISVSWLMSTGTIPAGDYVYALKFQQSGNIGGTSILMSPTQTGNVYEYGINGLPSQGNENKYVYYVMKRPSTATPDVRYLGARNNGHGNFSYLISTPYNFYWNNISGLPIGGFVPGPGYTSVMQSLSTNIKQW